MNREQIIEKLIGKDMDEILTGDDNSFLYNILITGFKGYDNMTNKELKEELKERKVVYGSK